MPQFDLIIFDCDGVLIDSEVLANQSEVTFLQSFGIHYELSDYMMQFVGKSNKDVLSTIQEQKKVPLPEDFWKQAEAYTFAVFEKQLKPIEGISHLLSELKIARCIGSSSSLQRLDLSLNVTGLYKYFAPNIYSAEQVDKGKPAPDLFLFAASKMQVEPESCLVIEDSPHGVQAAMSAGMQALGFTGGSHIQAGHDQRLKDAGASAVYEDMHSLARAVLR